MNKVDLPHTIHEMKEEVSHLYTPDGKQVLTPIVDTLENYYKASPVRMHIPGHAGGRAIHPKFQNLLGKKAVAVDTTDDFYTIGTLHPATGSIKESQDLAAEVFGAKRTFFLLNGSTIGNLALALTLISPNDKVIVGRNCHKSVINGLTLTGGNPIWALPDKLEDYGIWGAISADTIKKLIKENPDAKLVWLTSPTYEGVVSNIEEIAEVCKKNGVKLVVDEAHGCLWSFSSFMPTPSLELGADAVVHSLHKTGGSFSQSSMLHLGYDSTIDEDELEGNLKMLHTTSPSLTLLASLDAARGYISSIDGLEYINNAALNSIKLRDRLNSLPRVNCLKMTDKIIIDPTKLYITIDGLSGKRLQSILEAEYHIEVEAGMDKGILALSNIGNTNSELDYFYDCIKAIVSSDYMDVPDSHEQKYMPFETPEIACSPRTSYTAEKEYVPTEHAINRIAAEVIAECPPGIPVLVPGERVKETHLAYLANYEKLLVMKEINF